MTGRLKTGRPAFASVAELLDWATLRLARARLHYGHGTDNPRDDAAALVFHALGLAHESAPASYRLRVTAAGAARAQDLVERRIRERLPSAYLTGVSWFAGHEIRVTTDVLVPRSPIAELCLAGFAPWVDPARVAACSTSAPDRAASRLRLHMPCQARAWTRPIYRREPWRSPARTCGGIGLGRRVRVLRADVYEGLGSRRYDIVVSNPPYVSAPRCAGCRASIAQNLRSAFARPARASQSSNGSWRARSGT